MNLGIELHTKYEIECWREGNLAWVENFPNMVTTVGKNKILDACFKTGEAANQWFIGLVSNLGGYSISDTMASHPGWLEGVPYSNATRRAFVGSTPAAGSMDNRASKAVFNINATLDLNGAFLVDNSTKSGSTGTLYGTGGFSVAARSVMTGDILNIVVTLSA